MITIKTHGEYYFKTENLKGRKPFVQVINAPSLGFFKQTTVRYTGTDDDGKLKFQETEFVNVRGIIKKKLLPLLLAPKHSDFIRVRSVTIDEIIESDGKPIVLPITLQSRNQLIELCQVKKYPIEAASYLDIDELRADIMEYQVDPDAFLRTLERKNKQRLEERDFLSMNGLIPVETPTPVGVGQEVKTKKRETSAAPKTNPETSAAPAGVLDL